MSGGRGTPAVVLLAAMLALPAPALEPASVSVLGVVPADGQAGGAPRDRALREAMTEAVLAVSLDYLPPAMLEVEEELEWLRERLRARAPAFILTYRIDGSLERMPSMDDPDVEEWVLPVTATVDLAQVREYLREAGLLATTGDRPSVALRVRLTQGMPAADAASALTGFEQFLLRRLEADGMVVVEPALRPAGLKAPADTYELSRALGADLALDVTVSWRPRSTGRRVSGGSAEVGLRAVRVLDGFEVARARFEAPGYHQDRREALVRALAALREQVAQNLKLQLDANWQVLAREEGPLVLTLVEVDSLLQVEAVRDTLAGSLGADQADLVEIRPRAAQIRVESSLSPGALQDRLAAVVFEGFRLEPVEVAQGRVLLRVEPTSLPEDAETLAPDRVSP